LKKLDRSLVAPIISEIHTLKFSNFRMWIEKIIKQEFYHNFKNFLNIYFVYRKSNIGKSHCLIFWIK
jgi:hypothetical protein